MPTATNRGDTPDKSEMRACPFCGGNLLKTGTVRCTDEVFWGYVECECGTVRRIDSGTEADAIAAWNTRASSRPADQVPDMVEALKTTTTHLIAAISLLRKIHGDLAPSKKHALFGTKLADYEKASEKGRETLAALQAVPAASEVGWRNRCEHLMACIDYSNEAAAPPDELDPEDIALIDETRAALKASGEE